MKRLRKVSQKTTRLEKIASKKEKIDYHQKGTGRYVYKNKSSGTLNLPKAGLNGEKHVPVGGEWEGDSYFMYMVGKEATISRILESPERKVKPAKPEETMSEEKLILDQPDQVTDQGKVEHVCCDPQKQLNEGCPNEEDKKDVLLREDPLDGVKIILND